MRGIASFKGTNKEFQEYLKERLMPAALEELEIEARAELFAIEMQLAEELDEAW